MIVIEGMRTVATRRREMWGVLHATVLLMMLMLMLMLLEGIPPVGSDGMMMNDTRCDSWTWQWQWRTRTTSNRLVAAAAAAAAVGVV